MADVGITVFNRHQSAAWQVGSADLLDTFADAELRQSLLAHNVSFDSFIVTAPFYQPRSRWSTVRQRGEAASWTPKVTRGRNLMSFSSSLRGVFLLK